MADWLILRMPEDAGLAASWLACDATGRMLTPPQSGRLSEGAALAAGRRLIVLVPASAVLLTTAELPPKANPAKIAQIVPYALEEQLATDVDELHFAVGKRPVDGTRTPVAVVAKSALADWLKELAAVGAAPNALYAESDLLPAVPGQTTALLEGDVLTIRKIEGSPVVLPADSLSDAFELIEGSAALPAIAVSTSLVLYASPEDWMRREADAEALRSRYVPFKVQLLPNGCLPLLAQALALGQGIDLLQGAYAPARTGSIGFSAWRLAAILAGCLIGLHAAGEALSLARLKQTEHQIDGAMSSAVRGVLPPGEAVGGDARRKIEARLAAVRGSAAIAGFLPALSALSQAHAAAPRATVESLSYGASALEMRVSAPDAATLDRMSQQLRSAGWQADLTSGNTRGASYEGRIQMKSAAGAS